MAAEYVAWRRRSCGDISLAADLGSLCGTLKLLCPNTDWFWLQSIANRLAAAAPPPARKYNLVTSDRLYALGAEAHGLCRHCGRCPRAHRDKAGHSIPRRLDYRHLGNDTAAPWHACSTANRASSHKSRRSLGADIPAADTKTRRPLDYSIPKDLSARIDLYRKRFRSRIRGSDKHAGLWPSHHSIPMRPDSINVAVQKRTKKAFGFGVNLHRFRHAAATFWSVPRPGQRARRQRPSRSSIICHDRKALHHGSIAPCG